MHIGCFHYGGDGKLCGVQAKQELLELGPQGILVDDVAVLALHDFDGVSFDEERGVDRRLVDIVGHIADEPVQCDVVDRAFEENLFIGEVELETLEQVYDEVALAGHVHGGRDCAFHVDLRPDVTRHDGPLVVAVGEDYGIALSVLHVELERSHGLVTRQSAKTHARLAGDADTGVHLVIVKGGIDQDAECADEHDGCDCYKDVEPPTCASPLLTHAFSSQGRSNS